MRMKVILAQPRGFCAGVIRAIDIVERALDKYGAPVYVRHEIVHNRHVVETLKGKGAKQYLGVATGMNSLIRPALYGAYHEIVNLSRLAEPAGELADVVGPICESGDVLGHDRLLPPSAEGDILLIANAGAYGHSMSSRYNLREPAEELIL